MSDQAKTQDTRIELTPNGSPLMVPHKTEAPLTEGLAGWFRIGGKPAAMKGSSGQNKGDHDRPNAGQKLVELPTEVRVLAGETGFRVGGKPIATTRSRVKVPCVLRPVRTDGLQTGQSFFRVNQKPAIRGQG